MDDNDDEKQVVISEESSKPEWGIVNIETPIAKALLGREIGDIVTVNGPVKKMHLRILDIC